MGTPVTVPTIKIQLGKEKISAWTAAACPARTQDPFGKQHLILLSSCSHRQLVGLLPPPGLRVSPPNKSILTPRPQSLPRK